MTATGRTADDGIIELIGAELRKQIAQTFTAEWKDQVRQLIQSADREYGILSSFRNELAAALVLLRTFPQRYGAMAGKAPHMPPALIRRSREEESPDPLMPGEEWAQIHARIAERDPRFAKMLEARHGESER